MKRFHQIVLLCIVLASVGCSTRDHYGWSGNRHNFHSTIANPLTLRLKDIDKGVDVWQLDIPVNHKAVVDFDREEGRTHRVSWAVLSPDTNWAGLPDSLELDGSRLMLHVVRRDSADVPQSIPSMPPELAMPTESAMPAYEEPLGTAYDPTNVAYDPIPVPDASGGAPLYDVNQPSVSAGVTANPGVMAPPIREDSGPAISELSGAGEANVQYNPNTGTAYDPNAGYGVQPYESTPGTYNPGISPADTIPATPSYDNVPYPNGAAGAGYSGSAAPAQPYNSAPVGQPLMRSTYDPNSGAGAVPPPSNLYPNTPPSAPIGTSDGGPTGPAYTPPTPASTGGGGYQPFVPRARSRVGSDSGLGY